MAGALAVRSGDARVPALAIANKFGKYRPEEEKAVRKVEVVEDETLKQMKEAWKELWLTAHHHLDAVRLVKPFEYSASDVEKFSIAIAEFQADDDFSFKAGIFLSVLINGGKENDYIIHTAHMAVPIHCIGFNNTKCIVVEGDAGGWCGQKMQGGRITVHGNTANALGYDMEDGCVIVTGNATMLVGLSMKNGAIVVKGDAGNQVGTFMEGGSITVNGNVDDTVGEGMLGGEIRLEGGYRNIATWNFKHGKIFHKGKLIVDK
jgi:hypothetical protein